MNSSFFQKALEAAAQVKNPVAAAVFALVLACLAFSIAFKKKDKATVLTLGLVLGVGMIFLGALPLVAKLYLNTHGVYEVRVMVLGADQSPVDDATVVCSPGGEEKRISGGWECDVAPRSRPENGLFTAYATVKTSFLVGKGELHLAEDYNPLLTIHLESDATATVQGEVQGKDGRALAGAWVSAVGHEAERVQTGAGGGFVIKAHAAKGQMLKVHAEAPGYRAYEGLQQAGDSSISIRLTR